MIKVRYSFSFHSRSVLVGKPKLASTSTKVVMKKIKKKRRSSFRFSYRVRVIRVI